MDKVSPLQTGRFYKVKHPRRKFLCALCSAPRQMRFSKNLNAIHFVQVLIVTAFLGWLLFPIMEAKVMTLIVPVWMIFELINKTLYRRELPCPYCGFDATWYRKDVKVANRLVKDYWQKNFPDLVEKSEQGKLKPEALVPGQALPLSPKEDINSKE